MKICIAVDNDCIVGSIIFHVSFDFKIVSKYPKAIHKTIISERRTTGMKMCCFFAVTIKVAKKRRRNRRFQAIVKWQGR